MAGDALSLVVLRWLRDPSAFRAAYACPIFLWEAPPDTHGAHWDLTRGGSGAGPGRGDPRVLKVHKAERANAFSVGVSIGRVASNDVVLEDDSVSRFHAWVSPPLGRRGWQISDAESRNGTWLNDRRLSGSTPVALCDGDQLRLGKARLRFLLPESLRALVEGAS